MTSKDLHKTLDTIENTLRSLRVLIDDVAAKEEILKKDQEENVRVRKQIIDGQKKAIADLKAAKEEQELADNKMKNLILEKKEILELTKINDDKKADIKEQMKKLDDKIKVSGNLSSWTSRLEEQEQVIKADRARIVADRRAFKEEKTRIELLEKSNLEYKISLDRRKKVLESNEARVKNILGNV